MTLENSAVASVRFRKGSGGTGEHPNEPSVHRLESVERSQSGILGQEEACTERRRNMQECIAWLLKSGIADHIPVEKRAHRRYAFRKPITVTPVNNQSGRPDRIKSFAAFGVDISTCGICFLARQLVPARQAVLSVDGPSGEAVNLLFEPRWVRFTRGGWYQTGGRLLQVLPEEKEPFLAVRLVDAPPDFEVHREGSRHS